MHAESAIISELGSDSPAGLPAGCQVTSTKSGLPIPIRSKRAKRLMAPDLVRGGKNSREKNLSLDSIRVWIFSFSVDSNELQRRSGDSAWTLLPFMALSSTTALVTSGA